MPLMGLPLRCGDASNLEKGSHLPPGNTKLGNLRDSHDLPQLPLLNQIFRILLLCVEPTQGCQKCDRVHRYTRWIGGLSHQSSNLSHLYNLLWKVVIHALLDIRFKGVQVVTYLTNCQTTKIALTKVFPKSLGVGTWINKVDSSSWIYSCSRVEGQWLDNRPNYLVPDTQMTAPEAWASSPYILASPNSKIDHCDII